MTKLQQLAFDALTETGNLPLTDATDEDVNETNPIQTTDNGDGTVTMTVNFSLDPKVVAEKAKAMPKGVKRDDMTDDLSNGAQIPDDDDRAVFADDLDDEGNPIPVVQDDGDDDDDDDDDDMAVAKDANDVVGAAPDKEDGEGDDDDEDEYNGVNVEDSAPKNTLFGSALDSLTDVQDARNPNRHKTPLENCRAKDPRFCPYHGEQAFQKTVEDALSAKGVVGPKVECKLGEDKMYSLSVTVPLQSQKDAEDYLSDLMKTDGIVDKTDIANKSSVSSEQNLPNSEATVSASFETLPHSAKDTDANAATKMSDDVYHAHRRMAMTDEWTENLAEDMMKADPSVIDDDFMNRFSSLIDKLGMLKETMTACFDNPQPTPLPKADGSPQDPTNGKDWNDAYNKARDEYHYIKAQLDYPEVQSKADAQTIADAAIATGDQADATYHELKGQVNDVKANLFGTGQKQKETDANGNPNPNAGQPDLDAQGHYKNAPLPKGYQHGSTQSQIQALQTPTKKGTPRKGRIEQAKPWVSRLMGMSSKLGGTIASDYDEAKKNYSDVCQDFDNGTATIKDVRAALGNLDYQSYRYDSYSRAFAQRQPEFMRDMYDYNSTDPDYAQNNPKAFPNGRPQ